MLLHVASTPLGAALTVSIIFLLIFAMSFAFGPAPEGGRRFSADWTRAWLAASVPRMVVSGIFAGLVLAAVLSYGNSSSQAAVNCDRGVPPLSGQPVTRDRTASALLRLGEMADAANSGDLESARSVWLTGDAHNLTHDIDGPLRNVSDERARALCEKVVALENVMVGELVAEAVSEKAAGVATELALAQQLVHAGGTPAPVIFEPCGKPVGAIGDSPLTEARLLAAIEQMRQVASLAGGDRAGAEATFAGDAHNITHDIDAPLRSRDEEIAIDLCLAATEIEVAIGTNYDGEAVSANAEEAARLLEAAGRSLGILQ